ncbi:MAG TPA: hypothetical protein VF092_22620, partial [Longimicrobium sp.]
LHGSTQRWREYLAAGLELLDYAHEPQYVVANMNEVHNFRAWPLNGYAAILIALPHPELAAPLHRIPIPLTRKLLPELPRNTVLPQRASSVNA